MLRLENICQTFNKNSINEKVLFNDFSLSVARDEFVSVVGSNGSGKTTLLNIISGNIMPDSGRIFVDGNDVTKLKNYKRAKKYRARFSKSLARNLPDDDNF